MKVKNIRKYLTEEQITERVKAMGEQISKDYGGETVYLICILKGSIFFTCELAKRITSPVEIDFMSVSSYSSSSSSTHPMYGKFLYCWSRSNPKPTTNSSGISKPT